MSFLRSSNRQKIPSITICAQEGFKFISNIFLVVNVLCINRDAIELWMLTGQQHLPIIDNDSYI